MYPKLYFPNVLAVSGSQKVCFSLFALLHVN